MQFPSAAVLISFCCSCFVFAQSATSAREFVWLDLPPLFQVPFGLTLDQLSRTMAIRGFRRRSTHSHLFARLHAGRRRQVPLFRGAVAFHVRDARDRFCEQFRDAFHLLGIGRVHIVCLDRSLVLSRRRSRRSEQGIHHHTDWRFRIHDWHPDDLDDHRLSRFCRKSRRECRCSAAMQRLSQLSRF